MSQKEAAMEWQDAFLDELQKIAEAGGESTQELIQDLTPAPRGFLERAAPLASTIGGTLGGAGLASHLSGGAGGWKGTALKGLAGVAGGLAGLGAGSAGTKAMIRDRRLEAYQKLMGNRQ